MRHTLPNGYDIQVEHVEYVTTVNANGANSSLTVHFASGAEVRIVASLEDLTAARLRLVQAMGERD